MIWRAAFLFALLLPHASVAQEATAARSPGHQLPSPTAVATRTSDPIVVDGRLDEPAWSTAPPITAFMQRDPHEGQPSSERTEVRILFDRHHLYLGIFCYDSNPAGIVATELRRDAQMEGDDIFEAIFDTFHDHRNGFRFRVNPLGTMRDESVTNEGQANENWDEKWDARARITADGWLAEVAIPFKALRFNAANSSVWGMNLHRTIIRKNEDVFWSGYKRGYTMTRISGGGHLEGLSDIEGFHVRLKPYVAGSAARSGGALLEAAAARGHIGLEDVKYMVTPQLVLDATINPDFAQADVDQAQVNLSRFSLFFPEKREFFQEGSGTFQFGTGSRFGNATDFLLFHSRRIGLSDNRAPIPIVGGFKVTGKEGPLDIGVLNMQTGRDGSRAGQNFTVLRAKSNILSTSYVGAMLTSNTGSPLGGGNHTVGVDSNFRFIRYLNLNGFLAKSSSTGVDGRDLAARGILRWESDRSAFGVERMQIDENFRPEMGFVRRAEPGWKGLQRTQLDVGYHPRPRIRGIRQVGISGDLDYLANREGVLETRERQLRFSTSFQSGDNVGLDINDSFERLQRPFRIAGGGGTIPAGDYRFSTATAKYTAHQGRRTAGTIGVTAGGFYDGTIADVELSPLIRANANLSFSPAFEWSQISRRGLTFTTRELNAVVDYSLSQKWLTRSTAVWNSQDREVLANFRLNYIFRPGDDLFVVYSQSSLYGDAERPADHTFTVKLTYSLDH